MQNNEGSLVLCGICCVWPLMVGMGGWWLRGWFTKWAEERGGQALWEIWTHR